MNDLLILCYHAVSEDWPTDFAVSPQRLGEQLHDLGRRGYRAATLSEALEQPPGEKTLVVTFDDAYASVLERALPVMEELGVPGTMYVPTGYVSGEGALEWDSMQRWLGTPHRDELRCMSWDGVRGLARAGWEIGSHSVTHPDLRSLADAELGEELIASKRRCEEELQRPCRSLAYPVQRPRQARDGCHSSGRIRVRRDSRQRARDPRRRPGPPRDDGRALWVAARGRLSSRQPLAPALEDLGAAAPGAGVGARAHSASCSLTQAIFQPF